MKKGFTLIELLVAIGILAMILSFAAVIFQVSIDSYRTATANAEIMQKLRAITDQLNTDFKGIIWTFPGRIMHINSVVGVKADCMAFLANGDFQSTRQYDGKTVRGNVASVFYGQAADANPTFDPNIDPFTGKPKEKILVRRQTILTSDSNLPDADSDLRGEYYKKSLSEWEAIPPFADVNEWTVRPYLDLHSPIDLVMYMANGVDNFTIEQLGGIDGEGRIIWVRSLGSENIYTKALKFTFTLYDSKGVIKGGRTFTHIVYLDTE